MWKHKLKYQWVSVEYQFFWTTTTSSSTYCSDEVTFLPKYVYVIKYDSPTIHRIRLFRRDPQVITVIYLYKFHGKILTTKSENHFKFIAACEFIPYLFYPVLNCQEIFLWFSKGSTLRTFFENFYSLVMTFLKVLYRLKTKVSNLRRWLKNWPVKLYRYKNTVQPQIILFTALWINYSHKWVQLVFDWGFIDFCSLSDWSDFLMMLNQRISFKSRILKSVPSLKSIWNHRYVKTVTLS